MHFSHYGRMCPIETPEGPNIGLIGAPVDLRPGQRVRLHRDARTARSRTARSPARSSTWPPTRKRTTSSPRRTRRSTPTARSRTSASSCAARRRPPASTTCARCWRRRASSAPPPTSATCRRPRSTTWTSSPKQIVSVGTALIPFLEHDDANRALMGANMQKQAVPLVRAEAPYIGTGIEDRAARDAGRPDPGRSRTARSPRSPASTITVQYKTPASEVYRLAKFRRSNQDTCINQRAARPRGRQGASRARSSPTARRTDHGELALGKNLLVALMPWEGYNFEDAIILSERLVKDDVLTSIHIHEHEVDARDTKLGPEEITRDIPNLCDDILARPRRPRHHPRRRRGRPRRRARRQGHAEGRDRADAGGAPAAGDLR